MKNTIFALLVFGTMIGVNAQVHDYDNQGTIFSTTPGINKKVGIGLETPLEKLHVKGNILTNETTDSGEFLERGIFFKSYFDDNQKYNLSIFNLEKVVGRYALGINAYNGIFLTTGSSDARNTRMMISETGDIGISNETPQERVHITGNLLLNEVNDIGIYQERGVFFKDYFKDSPKKYNLSIFNLEDVEKNFALGVNAFNGIYFNTGDDLKRKTRMLIAEDGKVGIGTEKPDTLLDINGKTTTQTAMVNPDGNTGYMLQMGTEFDNGRRQFNFGHSSSSFVGYSILSPKNELTGAVESYSFEPEDTGDNLTDIPVPDEPNYITRLQFSAKTNYTAFGLKDAAGNEVFKTARSAGIGTYIHLPRADSRMVIGSWGNYRLAQGYKLVIKDGDMMVEGRLDADEVKVELHTPPDYVFQKYYTGKSSLKSDYVMPTIEEVAAFTEKNHHLPDVPSAEKIKEDGLLLKEMTATLLQKVEELTLYTIEQEKRIKALESQLEKK